VHSLIRSQVITLEDLRAAFNSLRPGDPAAMSVERNGQLLYLTFEME